MKNIPTANAINAPVLQLLHASNENGFNDVTRISPTPMSRYSSRDSLKIATTNLNPEAESFILKFGDESNDIINRGVNHTPLYPNSILDNGFIARSPDFEPFNIPTSMHNLSPFEYSNVNINHHMSDYHTF